MSFTIRQGQPKDVQAILDLSNEALLASEKGHARLMEAFKQLDSVVVGNHTDFDLKSWEDKCYSAMNDDFNTPILIAHLFEGVKEINLLKEGNHQISQADKAHFTALLKAFVLDVLGLKEGVEMATTFSKERSRCCFFFSKSHT